MDGQNSAGDESHKVTKSIRVTDDKVFHGVYTMVNEFGQVQLQVSFICTLGPYSVLKYISVRVSCATGL